MILMTTLWIRSNRKWSPCLRAAAAAAASAPWELAMTSQRGQSPAGQGVFFGRRVGVVLVAAVIIVVFFVPLPHVSIFDRLGKSATTLRPRSVQLRRRPISSPAWLCRPGVRRSTYSAAVAVVGDCASSCGAVRVPPPIRESISPR